MDLKSLHYPVINGGKAGNLIITSIYDLKDSSHPNVRKSVPELLNKRNQKNVATIGQLRPFLVNDEIRTPNYNLLHTASPMISRTVGAFEWKLPLADLPVVNGKVVFKRVFSGEKVFIVGSKDKLLEAAKIAITEAGIKAGLNEQQTNQQINEKLSMPGVFIAMESNYDIVDASLDGKSYTILADDMTPQQLAQVLKFYFGNFNNGDRRKIDAAIGIPIGEVTSEKLGVDVGDIYFSCPGPAILDDDYLRGIGRFVVSFGDGGGHRRFGSAQWQPDLDAVVLEKGNALLKTSLAPEQVALVNEMMAAAKVN